MVTMYKEEIIPIRRHNECKWHIDLTLVIGHNDPKKKTLLFWLFGRCDEDISPQGWENEGVYLKKSSKVIYVLAFVTVSLWYLPSPSLVYATYYGYWTSNWTPTNSWMCRFEMRFFTQYTYINQICCVWNLNLKYVCVCILDFDYEFTRIQTPETQLGSAEI